MSRRGASEPGPIRVVVIDDDDFEREYLVDLLRKAGFDVSSLCSVFGVTNHLVHERAQVVVLDVMMPSIRGDKLAALLRRNPALPRLAVVLISGLPEVELAPILAQVQFDAFVAKANVRKELVATIHGLAP